MGEPMDTRMHRRFHTTAALQALLLGLGGLLTACNAGSGWDLFGPGNDEHRSGGLGDTNDTAGTWPAHVEGTLLCQTAVTLHTGASVNGRLLAQIAAHIDKSVVVAPAPRCHKHPVCHLVRGTRP